LIVHFTAPKDPQLIQEHAEKLGRFVGPIGGAISSFYFAKRLGNLLEGSLLGLALALLDFLLLLAAGASFQWIFVLSNVGKIVVASLSGYWEQERLRDRMKRWVSYE